MKKALIIAIIALIAPTMAFAGGSSSPSYSCDTKYPVVLAHGMFANPDMLGFIDYWWGIPDELEDEGANVYITKVNAMDGTVAKAQHFKSQYLQILATARASKANIIGHSHGTVYTRYAISNLGLATKVASLSSLSGPHRGSSLVDIILNDIPGWLQGLAGDTINLLYTFVLGDDDPNFIQNCMDLSTDYMTQVFNPNTPNKSGIYYQSWGAKAKWSCPNIILQPLWAILLITEGANDGVVGVASSKWGNWRGTVSGSWWTPGVDHMGIVGHLFGNTPGFDHAGFYVDIVKGLKSRGL